jgi:serine/threonine protein phosphatase PrpC
MVHCHLHLAKSVAPCPLPPPWQVLASDGLWNTMDSQQVADWLVAAWDGGRVASLQELASALTRICVTSPSTSYDNTSVMLVQLNVPEGPEPADEDMY